MSTEPAPKTRPRRSKPLPPVEIREMELRDVANVFELGQKLFTAEEWPTLYRSWDDHELALLFSNDAETCLVAEADEKIVGFALGRVMEKPRSAWRYGWLLWLGMDRRFKRTGVATRLVKQLKGLFIARDARIMLVDTAPPRTTLPWHFSAGTVSARKSVTSIFPRISAMIRDISIARMPTSTTRKIRLGRSPAWKPLS